MTEPTDLTPMLLIQTNTGKRLTSIYAEVNEINVGVLDFLRVPIKRKNALVISALWTAENYRRRKVARSLLAQLPRHIKDVEIVRMDCVSSVALRLMCIALKAQPNELIQLDTRKSWAESMEELPYLQEVGEWGKNSPVHAEWRMTPGLGYELRSAPLTPKEMHYMRGDGNFISAVIPVSLSDAVHTDSEEWLDYILEKAFGASDLTNVEYTIVGVNEETQEVHIRVQGNGEDFIEDLDLEDEDAE